MENYILFYSNYCNFSKKFVQELYKTEFYEKFQKVCVDKNPRIPKEITMVPTIIVPRLQKPLVAEEAFHWLNGMKQMVLQQQETPQNQPQQGKSEEKGDPTNLNYSMGAVTAYSNTMDGFSDSFSFLSNESPLEHSFSFLGGNDQKIATPQEDGSDPRAQMEGSSKKTQIDKDFERMMEQRSREVAKPIART